MRTEIVVDPATPRAQRRRWRRGLEARGITREWTEATAAHETRGADTYCVVGSDATVALLLDGIWIPDPYPVAVTVLPTGPSALHRTFALPDDVAASLGRLDSQERYPIDTGWYATPGRPRRWFVNSILMGPRRRSPRRGLGDVDVDTSRRARSYAGVGLLLAMNGQFLRDGTNVAPRALLADGALDVQVWTGRVGAAAWRQARLGRHLAESWVHRFSAPRATITTDAQWWMRADEGHPQPIPFEVGVEQGLLELAI